MTIAPRFDQTKIMISCYNIFDQPENAAMADAVRDTERVTKKLWLVDDDPGYRASLAELLNRTGEFECVRQFPSAEAVIDGLIHEPPPDAILLDFNMGGMTGLDALGPIKALASSTPVLMLTMFWHPGVRALALRSGASDYLLKSFSVEEISERIHQAGRATGDGECAAAAVEEDQFPAGRAPEALPDWPERRAPIARGERHRNDDIRQAHAEPGRPTVRWRCVSPGLARGVRYLRLITAAVFVRLVQMSFRL